MLLLINLGVVSIVALIFQKAKMQPAIIRQVGLLELTWICILLMTGLYFAFGTLEVKNSNQSFADAAGTDVMQTFYILGGFMLAHLIIMGTIVRRQIATRFR